MNQPPSTDRAAMLSEALVLEIKAEMGRRDLSSRGLGRLIGESSQYVSMRLDGGNPRTGLRVPINVVDLFAIGSALEVEPTELLARAEVAVDRMMQIAEEQIQSGEARVMSGLKPDQLRAKRPNKDALGYIEGVDDPADYSPGFVEKSIAQEAERVRSDALARKRQSRTERRNDYSSFEGSDVAARDEDREKPRID